MKKKPDNPAQRPPVPEVIAIQEMGDSEEDFRLLVQDLDRAEKYLLSHSWCDSITEQYFGGGVGSVFVIFLIRIVPSRPEVPEWMWTMVGDIPCAYLPLEDAGSVLEAFKSYKAGMRRWIDFARSGGKGYLPDDVPTINVPCTTEWADELEKRIYLLDDLIPAHLRSSHC